jgi:hypothetical protein
MPIYQTPPPQGITGKIALGRRRTDAIRLVASLALAIASVPAVPSHTRAKSGSQQFRGEIYWLQCQLRLTCKRTALQSAGPKSFTGVAGE